MTNEDFSLPVRERLAQSDPSNAGWQRDLWVSYQRLAMIAETEQPAEARAWWQKCHDQLAAMKARGILHPPDEPYLEQARAKVAAAAAAEIEIEAGGDAVEGEAEAEMDAGGAAGVEASSPEAPAPRPWWARWFGRN